VVNHLAGERNGKKIGMILSIAVIGAEIIKQSSLHNCNL
jgi:hypothetical protein